MTSGGSRQSLVHCLRCLKTGLVDLLGDDFVYSAHSLGSTSDTVFCVSHGGFFFCPRGGGIQICTRRLHLEFGHHFLALYVASFGVEVSPAEYAVRTLWEMASGEGFRILWFDSGYCSSDTHIFHVEVDSGFSDRPTSSSWRAWLHNSLHRFSMWIIHVSLTVHPHHHPPLTTLLMCVTVRTLCLLVSSVSSHLERCTRSHT